MPPTRFRNCAHSAWPVKMWADGLEAIKILTHSRRTYAVHHYYDLACLTRLKNHFNCQTKQERTQFPRKEKLYDFCLLYILLTNCPWLERWKKEHNRQIVLLPFLARLLPADTLNLNDCYCWKITVEIAQSLLLLDEVEPWTFYLNCLQCDPLRQKASGMAEQQLFEMQINHSSKNCWLRDLVKRQYRIIYVWAWCSCSSPVFFFFFCYIPFMWPITVLCSLEESFVHYSNLIDEHWSGFAVREVISFAKSGLYDVKVCVNTFTRSDTEMLLKFIPFRVVFYLLIQQWEENATLSFFMALAWLRTIEII